MDLSLFQAHHIDLSDAEHALFERLLALFMQYNAHTNLSAIRDEAGIIEKHFIDSLYGIGVIGEFYSRHREAGSDPENKRGILHTDWIASQARNDDTIPPSHHPSIRLLDIGSGGGFPGIPLKIVERDLSVTLLDSVGKKVKAMDHFITELGLEDIRAIQDRAEHLAKDPLHAGKYDLVVSRATAYITDILYWSSPFLAPGGLILLYKMPSDEEKKDREKAMKKYGLVLEGELEYRLAEKDRVIYVFRKK